MKPVISPFDAAKYIQGKAVGFVPQVAVVLGSGLSTLGDRLENPITIPYKDIPGFSDPGVAGHKGNLALGMLNGTPVAFLQGRAHYYEGSLPSSFQIPIRALKLLGCKIVILTNAAASLREDVQPGSLVVIKDHMNFQFQNPLVGLNEDKFGPRFPSLQNAYNDKLIALALMAGKELNIQLTTGVYCATLGPTYETPAEIRAFKILGADVVGMSTVPEVIIARHCDLKVLAVSTITNMACGMSDEYLTHESVLDVAEKAAINLQKLLFKIIDNLEVN